MKNLLVLLGFWIWFVGIGWSGELPHPLCRTHADCDPGEYCQKEICGIALGLCHPRPEICLEVYQPVCGCDGRTYSNACRAAASGENVAYQGVCGEEIKAWLTLRVEGTLVSAEWDGTSPEAVYTLYYPPYPLPDPIQNVFLGSLKSLTVELPYGAAFYVAVKAELPDGRFVFSNVEYFRIRAVWRPAPGVTWQWQLSGPVDVSVEAEMFDLDLFETPEETIAELKRRGRTVICYFSAGSFEPWRPDAGAFPEEVLGEPLEGWPDERWLDIRRLDLLAPIMRARLDLAVEKGCDGVEPDNVDAYTHDTGFPITYEDQLRYNVWLSLEAHKRGLSIGLKNDPEQAEVLEPFFDWALVEECFAHDEYDSFLSFIRQGKAVFEVEYELDPAEFCPRARTLRFSSMKKRPELDSWRKMCW